MHPENYFIFLLLDYYHTSTHSDPEMVMRTSDVFWAAIAEALRKNRQFIR